jgi:hypothetical protein
VIRARRAAAVLLLVFASVPATAQALSVVGPAPVFVSDLSRGIIAIDASSGAQSIVTNQVFANSITALPNGDLFVASPLTTGPGGTGPGRGEIVVLPDDNRDGVADAIVDDGGGVSLRSLTIVEAASEDGRGLAVELGLEARVGWRLADEKQREKWRGKIVRRDRAPAVAGMEQAGREALGRLLAAWAVRVAA